MTYNYVFFMIFLCFYDKVPMYDMYDIITGSNPDKYN